MKSKFKFDLVQDAVSDIASGKMVIVVDDENRENEGDLIMAASFATSEAINFMIKNAKGLVCLPVTDDILEKFELKDMVARNKDQFQTAFTVSIDGAPSLGISTGISAGDRARTIQAFINPRTKQEDIVTPGHVFPLRARKMGVLRRAGHTEAAVDLSRLAGLPPAGIICEIIKEDGDMARVPQLMEFAKIHNLKIITIQDLIRYRIEKESFIELIEEIKMPTKFGDFQCFSYKDIINDKLHLALVKGDIEAETAVNVRVHSECFTGDVLHSLRCDCGPQLDTAMQMIQANGNGIVLYMRQEGRGIGLENKIKAYKLQDNGKDTVEANKALGFDADLREYGVGAQILRDLGVRKINLITNNPRKVVGLDGYGLKIENRIPLIIPPNKHNEYYLKTKFSKLGHIK